MDLWLRPNFDHKFAHKLQKFRNLQQNGRKLQRKNFYGTGPSCQAQKNIMTSKFDSKQSGLD